MDLDVQTDHDLLVRIDERTRGWEKTLMGFEKDLSDCITRKEFMPVRNIAFGLVGIAVLTVLGAVLASVIRK